MISGGYAEVLMIFHETPGDIFHVKKSLNLWIFQRAGFMPALFLYPSTKVLVFCDISVEITSKAVRFIHRLCGNLPIYRKIGRDFQILHQKCKNLRIEWDISA